MTNANPAPGEATTERVKSIFSGIADSYDAFNMLASMGIDRTWRRRLVKACRITPESRVLDLCAGTGDVSFAIADQAHPAEVVVTDFTPEMLSIAEKKAAEHPGPTVLSFQLADAQELPFEDESFDVVTVAFGVRNLPSRERNFAEVMRVLKPGGRYVILEFSRPALRTVARRLSRVPAPRDPGDRLDAHERGPGQLRLPQRLDPPLPHTAPARCRAASRGLLGDRLVRPHGRYRGAAYRHQIAA